jgi:O-antigen/teichoic acid export membrane protein
VNFQMLSEDADDRELGKHATYLLELLILVMALVALFSKEVIVLFAQESFHAAFVIVPILAFGALVRTFSIVPYYRMIHEKKLPYALLTLIPSAIITLVVSWLLIPPLGILGAALGAAANYIAMLVFHFIWASVTTQRGVRVPFARLGLLLGGAALAVTVSVIQPGDFSSAWLVLKVLIFAALVALIAWLERERISAVLRDIRARRGANR